jgi:hypothetical protein
VQPPNSPHPISWVLVPSRGGSQATKKLLMNQKSRRCVFEILGKWTSIFGNKNVSKKVQKTVTFF